MKNLTLTCLFLFMANLLFSQASSTDNLKRATAREIGNNTRTDDVTISNIKRKMTSVTWYASANGVCYECDADDMVRSVHIVKIDCSQVPATPAPKKKQDSRTGQSLDNGKSSGPDEADCRKFKAMKKAGIGLSIGGGTSFLIGIILVAVGTPKPDGSGSAGAVAGGGALIGLGIPALGAGIPLAIIGSKKSKACGTTASLNLSGHGLALNF